MSEVLKVKGYVTVPVLARDSSGKAMPLRAMVHALKASIIRSIPHPAVEQQLVCLKLGFPFAMRRIAGRPQGACAASCPHAQECRTV